MKKSLNIFACTLVLVAGISTQYLPAMADDESSATTVDSSAPADATKAGAADTTQPTAPTVEPATAAPADSTATPAATTPAATDSTAAPAAASGQSLKATATLDQAEEIKQLGVAARKLAKTADDLYGEATTQHVTMTYQPEVIGRAGVVMIPRPQFDGTYLPPRKKWVNEYISELATLLPLVQEEFQDVIQSYPDEVIAGSQDSLDTLNKLMADVKARFDQLQALKQAGDYSNQPLSDASYAMHQDMEKAIKLGKTLFKDLKKAAAKNKSKNKK